MIFATTRSILVAALKLTGYIVDMKTPRTARLTTYRIQTPHQARIGSTEMTMWRDASDDCHSTTEAEECAMTEFEGERIRIARYVDGSLVWADSPWTATAS